MNSFLQMDTNIKSSYKDFLLATLFISLAYVLGNIPFLLVVGSQGLVGVDQNELLAQLQSNIGKTSTFFLILLPWVFVFLSFFAVARYVFNVNPRFFFTARAKFDWKRFLFAFGLWFVMSLIHFFITFNDQIENIFSLEKFIPLLGVAIVVLFCQTAAEELVFRSFLMKWFSKRTVYAWIPIVISGTIFGLLHGSNPEVQEMGYFALTYYICTGILLGVIAYMDNGLEFPMGFHFANNLFAAIVVTAPSQVFVTDAIFLNNNPQTFAIPDFFTMFGIQLVFTFICLVVFKWKFARKSD